MSPLTPPTPPSGALPNAGRSSPSLDTTDISTIASSLAPKVGEPPRATHKISLHSIRSNYRVIERRAGSQKCSVMAVVKADAYGHGAQETASYLWKECGCEAFCVATLDEAIHLREKVPYPVRILVLGAPVDLPADFDRYLHWQVEMMVSGPEVVSALMAWCADIKTRREMMVQNSAKEAMDKAALETSGVSKSSKTLGNVEGESLAREIREIMIHKKKEAQVQAFIESSNNSGSGTPSGRISPQTTGQGDRNGSAQPTTTQFQGIAHAASISRLKSERAASGVSPCKGGKDGEKKIRWHGMVDTGMGRMGFKPEEDWSVDAIKTLYRFGVEGSPIAFTGLCTHMAEASSSSTFTIEQFARFKILLGRLRSAGLSVETVHTDNSSALLETSLKHFDTAVLNQDNVDSRGYVRCGGAIYGQRPQFSELLPCSTLSASIRHVGRIAKGESVGYDRTWVATRDSIIATVAIGFADGVPRDLKGGDVEINGEIYPMVGNVCMDMLMVDVTKGEGTVKVGDTCVLWGPVMDELGGVDEQIKLKNIASALKTTQS
eukprot:CAMPEP_0118646330 /NCGR_PEP_ID=MMETSP0785-20121206/7995_1 /TAXON_ID=91992 /ORGANISM="Bolidomonas pacifica, Strain CCMP 1866" /LENGTH=548 /DNA_ID=CAMNT_0006538309 /DNA_START=91 /DNA_END=1734 /DNA_ORIENTATION=+